MHIEPLKCPKCGASKGPGSTGFGTSMGPAAIFFNCDCGHRFQIDERLARDQLVLSRGPFTRLWALANFFQYGLVEISPGTAVDIKLREPLDLLLKVFLTEYTEPGFSPMVKREILLAPDTLRLDLPRHRCCA